MKSGQSVVFPLLVEAVVSSLKPFRRPVGNEAVHDSRGTSHWFKLVMAHPPVSSLRRPGRGAHLSHVFLLASTTFCRVPKLWPSFHKGCEPFRFYTKHSWRSSSIFGTTSHFPLIKAIENLWRRFKPEHVLPGKPFQAFINFKPVDVERRERTFILATLLAGQWADTS